MKKLLLIVPTVFVAMVVLIPTFFAYAQPACPEGWIWQVYDFEMGGGYCEPPPTFATCADFGQLGTFPDCRDYTCQDYGYDAGTVGNCYNYTCQDYGYDAGTIGNCYNYPTCTPDASCASWTSVGSVCYDSCGNGYAGTVPTCTPDASCASWTSVGSVCYDSCGNGYAGTVAPDPTCADSGQQGTYPNCYSGSVSASCTPSPSTAAIGSPITWTASISGFSGTPTYAWTSSFGTPSSQTSTSNSYTTTYAANGQYAASVSVTSGGQSASASCTPVTVGNSCPMSADLTVTATPSRLRAGEESTIEYSFANVPQGTSCTLKENGTVISSPSSSSCNVSSTSLNRTIGAQTTYLLECGAVSEQVTVNVVANIVEF